MYFNTADFVNTAVGIRSAAKVYFGKEPRDLNRWWSSDVCRNVKKPSLFNPLRRIDKVRDRRNTVLGQMVRNHILDAKTKDSLARQPIVLHFHPESHKEGTATYFREFLREYMKNWAKENKNPTAVTGTFTATAWKSTPPSIPKFKNTPKKQ